ncbi:GNAT family N-acetyltransferase [Streptomyces sp. NPDC049916]|uniref:GNAT family N-acetyltransferase n=1 Tax=Streptomyces sp. NPDC049916 TaxID=3155156 RepID=UPI00343E8162
MTTTLRPSGPLQENADGVRARRYDVCDNGRPVGAVEIGTDEAFGPTAGVLRSLSVEEARRRRGRGVIASLAAEEVLRGWGCVQVRVDVPADNEPARRLAAALGYTERSRVMAKTLAPGAPAPLPSGLTSRAMSDEEFALWRQDAVRAYARNWVERGVPPEQARIKSEHDHAVHLPDGLATAGVRFAVLVAAGEAVGHVWVARRETPPGGAGGYVFDVEVREGHRGRGYGRSLMRLAEDLTRSWGADRLGLHVFATNTPALRLYESLGYATTRYHLAKAL